MTLKAEQLSDRVVPAVLDIIGGSLVFTDAVAETNNLTVAVSGGVYSFNDSITNILLGDGAKSAGWRGHGTKTVSGPASSVDGISISVGGGTNTVNVKSVLDPIAIDGGSGTTQVNLNSVAPSSIGNLASIQAEVTVIAGASTSLMASDYTGVARPNPVVISATAITGLAANAINLSGTLQTLTVRGSNGAAIAESYIVDAPDAVNFNLSTNNGDDDVTVIAWDAGCTGTFNGGSGTADVLTILSGVTVYGVEAGFETDEYNATGFGDLV